MKYYTADDARGDLEKQRLISGNDYQESQLLDILESIKERANNGGVELIWLVYEQSGKVMDYVNGLVPFYVDFISDSLVKLGYKVRIDGRYLYVNWEKN